MKTYTPSHKPSPHNPPRTLRKTPLPTQEKRHSVCTPLASQKHICKGKVNNQRLPVHISPYAIRYKIANSTRLVLLRTVVYPSYGVPMPHSTPSPEASGLVSYKSLHTLLFMLACGSLRVRADWFIDSLPAAGSPKQSHIVTFAKAKLCLWHLLHSQAARPSIHTHCSRLFFLCFALSLSKCTHYQHFFFFNVDNQDHRN
ncbi:hypothetical protein CRYO30217_01590 [Parvicella tangerina]|uniref:Uncharacterized protein n=1 Tax=Parvicella tangerina TaxID=2829795 RepID=A0A916JMR2_9FLAO|nr:hypothetical protein CRYO30217_01590 [Parvicella tangerina]